MQAERQTAAKRRTEAAIQQRKEMYRHKVLDRLGYHEMSEEDQARFSDIVATIDAFVLKAVKAQAEADANFLQVRSQGVEGQT